MSTAYVFFVTSYNFSILYFCLRYFSREVFTYNRKPSGACYIKYHTIKV